MGFIDRMTELVVGRQSAEKSERRRLEKHYSGLERTLSELKVVSFESPSDFPEDQKSTHSQTDSLPLSLPNEGSIRRGRPLLGRSQSELPEPKRPILPSPSGPPDITAIDLTPEQLKRTYSHDNVWDTKTQSLPPLPKMVGFGSYRRAADASIEWETHFLQRRLHGHHGSIADKLAELPLGIRPEALARYREESLRCDSFTSSRSSKSETSDHPMEERVDPETGERITLGFVPSHESSAASSFKEVFSRSRHNSSISLTSLSGDTYQRPVNPPVRRKSALRTSDPSPPLMLKTINEDNDGSIIQHVKKSRPCGFSGNGDSCDTAVFEDSGDDSVDEGDWLDVASQANGIQGSGLLSQKLQEIKDGAGIRKGGIDRSKTIRPSARPNPRRTNSRTGKPSQAKKLPSSGEPLARQLTSRRKPSQRAAELIEEEAENDKSSGESILYMHDTVCKLAQPASEVPTIMSDKIEKSDNDHEEEKADVEALGSNSTGDTLEPGRPDQKSGGRSRRSRRNRSGTAIRLFSGNAAPATGAALANLEQQPGGRAAAPAA